MDDVVKMNHIQFVGTHNSYKPGMHPAILAEMAKRDSSRAMAFDYGHPPMEEQLNSGIRKLEIDVYYDPEPGRYTTPMGLEVIDKAGGLVEYNFDPERKLGQTGFKVFHVQDFDIESHCFLLQECIKILTDWSETHPGHLPIIITMNAKDEFFEDATRTKPLIFDKTAFAALDAAIVKGFGRDRLIIPDDVRQTGLSLKESVLKNGWPSLADSRGKFLLVLDEKGEKRERYLDGTPSLEGKILFTNSEEHMESAAFFVINEPLEEADRIRTLVEDGFIIRTRADAGTWEARSGDTIRRDKAFEIGAQIVTTDYQNAVPRMGSDYSVSLPGGGIARCNPVSAPKECESSLLAN